MSDAKVVLVALTDDQCRFGNLDLKVLMRRALRVEDRMKKNVLIEDEQRRYNIFCERIEFYSHQLLAEGKVEYIDLGNEYIDIVSKISNMFPGEARDFRVAANFCLSEQIAAYIEKFEEIARKSGVLVCDPVQTKLAFYRKAGKDGRNVVELFQAWLPDSNETKTVVNPEELRKLFFDLKIADTITEDRGGGHFVALRDQIQTVVNQTAQKIPAAINFRELRHDVIAQVLHEFVYKSGRPMYAPVTYGEGAEATPFPLFCLKPKTEQSIAQIMKQPILNIGMMTARHSNDGLDVRVRGYWFRNQEISIGRTQSEIDDIAYNKSKELLLKMRSEGLFRINFYQTGFQPAVVGFYRALTEELIFRAKLPVSLLVTPYFFMGGEYVIGMPWS